MDNRRNRGKEENEVTIRPAEEGDLRSIASLLDSPGYPTVPPDLLPTLQIILGSAESDIFVALWCGSQVAGLISLHRFPVLRLKGRQAAIEELVVHPDHRGKG